MQVLEADNSIVPPRIYLQSRQKEMGQRSEDWRLIGLKNSKGRSFTKKLIQRQSPPIFLFVQNQNASE